MVGGRRESAEGSVQPWSRRARNNGVDREVKLSSLLGDPQTSIAECRRTGPRLILGAQSAHSNEIKSDAVTELLGRERTGQGHP